MEFIENVKVDLFPDEAYVFTPKGDIKELPAGATPVDFAYAVHTKVGNRCVAARIDGKLAALSTPLESGQTVKIITAPNASPLCARQSIKEGILHKHEMHMTSTARDLC